MKRILFLMLLLIGSVAFDSYSQDQIMLDENTVIKDEQGNKVDITNLMTLLNSGDWIMDPVKDSDGNILYLQLRKTSEEEKGMMMKMLDQSQGSDVIGQPAPQFSMKDLEGNIISSENTLGKVVVLNFWFTKCKPCIAEIPSLNKVYEKYKDNPNVVFASITFNEKEKVQVFLKEHPIAYPVVVEAKETCDEFKVLGYPTNIIIDKTGNYYDILSGGSPQIGTEITQLIQNVLDDVPNPTVAPKMGDMVLDENTVFKLENGEIIPLNKALEMLDSKQYDLLPQTNKEGEEYILLKKR